MERVGTYTLPGEVFSVPVRVDIMHRVVRWQRAKAQQVLTHYSSKCAPQQGAISWALLSHTRALLRACVRDCVRERERGGFGKGRGLLLFPWGLRGCKVVAFRPWSFQFTYYGDFFQSSGMDGLESPPYFPPFTKFLSM